MLILKPLENVDALKFYLSILIETIITLKTPNEECDKFFEPFLNLYPFLSFDVANELVAHELSLNILMLIVNMETLTEEKEKSLLMKWLSYHSVEAHSFVLVELILNKVRSVVNNVLSVTNISTIV